MKVIDNQAAEKPEIKTANWGVNFAKLKKTQSTEWKYSGIQDMIIAGGLYSFVMLFHNANMLGFCMDIFTQRVQKESEWKLPINHKQVQKNRHSL